MHIDSGYRCPALNQAIGGVPTSKHMQGLAADFVCPLFGDPKAVCLKILEAGIKFDQLIMEMNKWTHFGLCLPNETMRQEALTMVAPGKYEKGILP
jgi:hypothetical protein